ncbi:hypothetical protein TARUN_1536 [Trichoderma arundinaceum]|uniref:Zn(2)-C6 fungal-type domain-containing protein n=1 Tax=Trichoderma arundinaceum TaxID=490622 RepID=A0A395NYU1_TRIAR|nr:hypothetical protein TARUN_1536 [Trichoderma arundinaceum]
MTAQTKQKACISCTTAKRRCNKTRPFCRRCADKGLDCRYPAPVKRAAAARSSPSEGSADIPGHVYYINAHVSSLSASAPPSKLWFMIPDTWNIENSWVRAPPIPISVYRTFVRRVQHWLLEWVHEGHCPFIHRQLYADGFFPSFMQDAFSAISIHQSCNDRNQDMIGRIIQDKADSLIKSEGIETGDSNLMPMPAPVLNTSQHLARVQALLVYQILRLFDKGVWQQTHAEEAMPILLSWCQQMWDSAILDSITTSQTVGSLSKDAGQQGSLGIGDPAPRLWRLWILSESIRRTWFVAMATISAYRTMKDGWCECHGGIMFTVRKGLWLATSSSQWETLCRTEDPLFLPCLGNRAMLESCNPTEVDEFCFSCFALIWGPEWAEGWSAAHGARTLAV